MKCRYKTNHQEVYSSKFNISALSEVIVGWDNGGDDAGMDSCYIKDLDVFINGGWKDMSTAFREGDLITDNYNERFFEPKHEEDRKRGFTLD